MIFNKDSFSVAQLKVLFTNSAWAFARAWQANSTLVVFLVALNGVISFVPAAMALAMRSFINQLVVAIDKKATSFEDILPLVLLIFGITLVQVLCRNCIRYVGLRLKDDLHIMISSKILRKAAFQDVAFFENPGNQDLLERLNQNTASLFYSFFLDIINCLKNLVQITSLFVLLISIEPFIILVLLPIVLPYIFFHIKLANRAYILARNRSVKKRLTKYFVASLTHYEWVPEIRLLHLAPYLIRKYQELMMNLRNQDRSLYMSNLRGSSVFGAISTSLFFVLFSRVVYRAINGSLTVGDVAVYGGAATTLRNLVDNTIQLLRKLVERTLHIQDLREFLEEKYLSETPGGRIKDKIKGDITFENVSFVYEGSDKRVLKDISLNINKGETVAVVGENAAGKTTLAKLIARLYEPTEGSIYIDKHPISDWSITDLHSQVSFVFQNFRRFEATVAENIAFGDWSRLVNDYSAVRKVAEFANINGFIEKMPRGYDTKLGRMFGEDNLSGGQWQNIAIARAFARNASILILDEPTSNLDARSEYELFKRFKELTKGKTSILVSHRFSTISMADRIIVLENGRIAETGTHEELLQKGGLYATLYDCHHQQLK